MNDSGYDRGINDDSAGALQALHRKGVRLYVKNGVLRYRAPKGVITANDISVLNTLDSAQLAMLASHLDSSQPQPSVAGGTHLKSIPLSFNQLAHLQMVENRPISQITSVTRIRGALNLTAMREALAVIIERHDSLHTNIVSRAGEVIQEVSERVSCDMDVVDITSVAQCDRDREVHRQIASAIASVSDYSTAPLFRPVFLKAEESDHILMLTMDHMVSDGASRSIVESELFTAYEQLADDREVSLPAVQMQYGEYAIWQRTMLTDYFKAQECASYAWRRTRFPADGGARGERGWGQIRFPIDERVRQALEEFARRRGTTLVMVVLTAYVALVMRWCDTSDTLVQVMSNGRTSRMTENAVGYFAHPLYLHLSLEHNALFMDLLQAITAEYCQACERPNFYHSYTLNPRPEFTRNTCFNWIPKSRGHGRGELEGLKASNRRSRVAFEEPSLDTLNMDAEPSIGFQDMGGEIASVMMFPRDQFSASTMMRFISDFTLLLHTITISSTMCIREIMTT